MATKQINVRLDDVSMAFLEAMIEQLTKDGVQTNKTDVIQKALYVFARESVLGPEKVGEIIDRHYRGF